MLFYFNYRCPSWRCLVVDLPHCGLLCNISLDEVGGLFECQQIRSYRSTAIILFAHKSQEASNTLVTVDVTPNKISLRSIYPCEDVVDVALFTEPEVCCYRHHSESFISKHVTSLFFRKSTSSRKTETLSFTTQIPKKSQSKLQTNMLPKEPI